MLTFSCALADFCWKLLMVRNLSFGPNHRATQCSSVQFTNAQCTQLAQAGCKGHELPHSSTKWRKFAHLHLCPVSTQEGKRVHPMNRVCAHSVTKQCRLENMWSLTAKHLPCATCALPAEICFLQSTCPPSRLSRTINPPNGWRTLPGICWPY